MSTALNTHPTREKPCATKQSSISLMLGCSQRIQTIRVGATNSKDTAYQIEANALELLRAFGSESWEVRLRQYLDDLSNIKAELDRVRQFKRIPVRMPSGEQVTLSPGGQNPLIKAVIEEFCTRFMPAATVLYIGDAENKFLHLDAPYLASIGVIISPAAKMPDVVVHDTNRNWLILVEAVVSAGAVDAKRRKELKELFAGCTAGLVFVTAFENRRSFARFQQLISWETEVWIAAEPDHIVHFNGERFLGPYPDVMPCQS